MNNIFESGNVNIRINNRLRLAAYGIVFLALCALIIWQAGKFSAEQTRRQEESLENALSRDITLCYTLEGKYPPSLEYIKSNYGLVYDEEIFFVDYRPIASNIYPDITIVQK